MQRWVRRGIIPQPLRLSAQKIFWRQATIDALLAASAAAALANAPETAPLVQPTGRNYAAERRAESCQD